MLKAAKNIIVISVMAMSTNAMSKDISYDYVQGTYTSSTDSSLGVDIDADGFAVGGSLSVSPNIAITALLGSTSFDRVAGIDIDANEFNFGITAHTSVAPNTDVFGNFSIVNGEVEASDGFITVSDDDTGNAITVGLRHMASDAVEFSAEFSRVDLFDDTENTVGVEARFYANEKFSFGIGYNTGNDFDALQLSARIDIK